jgi:hypothetical protein
MSITSTKNNTFLTGKQACKTCLVQAMCSIKDTVNTYIECDIVREKILKDSKHSIEYLVKESENGNTSAKQWLYMLYNVAKEYRED